MQSVFLDLQAKTGLIDSEIILGYQNNLNLENPITNKSDRPLCANGDHLSFCQIYSFQLDTLGAICRQTYKTKIGLIESEIVRRYKKWSQS